MRFTISMCLLLFGCAAFAANVTVGCPGGTPGDYPSITAALAALDAQGPHTITVTGTCTENVSRGETPEDQHLMREYKQHYYRKWLDEPIPALRGKTPREAPRSRGGRAELDLLLRDMENGEARLPEAARFDVSRIRVELGL